jgi:hypothetical protein
VFNDEEEASLVNYLRYLSDRALPVSTHTALLFAKMVAIKVGKIDRFGPDGPTSGWFKTFYARHKDEIKLRKPSYIDRGRVAAASERVVRHHTEKLKKEIDDGKVEAHCIWNCDETGFSGRIGAKQRKFIGKAENRSLYAREVVSRDHITVHPCVSASGVVMPPCMIFAKSYPNTAQQKDQLEPCMLNQSVVT